MAGMLDPLKTPGGRRYMYEFMFYLAADRGPALFNHYHPEDKRGPLTATAGRMARSALDSALAGRGYSMEDTKGEKEGGKPLGLRALFGSIDDALVKTLGDENYLRQFDKLVTGDENPTRSKAYQQMLTKMRGYIGENSKDGILPVSPYDPRWSNRAVAMNNGTKMLGIPMDTVIEEVSDDSSRYEATGALGLDRMAQLPTNESEYATYEMVLANEIDDNGERKPAGKAFDAEVDLMGLGSLRPYMTDKEYNSVVGYVREGLSGPNGVDPSRAMSDDALARSVAVMEYVASSGMDYEIVQDRNPGQIKVRIKDAGLDVRLTDVRTEDNPNEVYVGRVYGDGIQSYMGYNRSSRENNDQTPLTPEDSVNLVRFALGESVERLDEKGVVGDVSNNPDFGRREAYHVRGTKSMTAKYSDDKFIFTSAKNHQASSPWFSEDRLDAAENLLRDAVDSSIVNIEEMIDVDGLVQAYIDNADDPDYVPDFAGPPEVSGLRQAYWDSLVNGEIGLLAPGYTAAQEQEAMDNGDFAALAEMSLGNRVTGEAVAAAEQDFSDQGIVDPSAVAMLRTHASLSATEMIGSYDQDEDGLRFDPVRASVYMESENSPWRNRDYIIGALRALDIPATELRGDDFTHRTVADRLINFNADSAVEMSEHDSDLIQRMRSEVEDAVNSHGAVLTSAMIDEKGVVQWTAERTEGGTSRSGSTREITGELGQILVPGEFGEVVTQLGSGENHLFVPGYTATIVPQKPGENKSFEARTRLRGYEQTLAEGIRSSVTTGLMEGYDRVGDPTNLNGRVRRLYSTTHGVDFVEKAREAGDSEMSRVADLLGTEALRVRYDNDMLNGASTRSIMRYEDTLERMDLTSEEYLRNDNARSAVTLTGGRNITLLSEQESEGFFDPVMSVSGASQGLVRYLSPDAEVGVDGSITPGDGEHRVPVAAADVAWAMKYDPHDRQNMTLGNVMHSSDVARGAQTAMMQFGGWNFEDAIVVSKDFAQKNQLPGVDGEMRDMVIGDKLSDYHGNKGVISLVVDPDMDIDEARAAGIEEQVEFFRDNRGAEVVMSPFSAISRHNGGTAREMMTDPSDITVRENDGSPSVVSGGMGPLNLIVTHMAVDAKTNVYDADAMAEGRGRKASSQLAWALQSKGCTEIMNDFYGSNSSGVVNTREYLLALGMDLKEDGTLAENFAFEDVADRKVFRVEDFVSREGNGITRSAEARKEFGKAIANAGGMIELPFEVTLRNGEKTSTVPLLSSHLRGEMDLGDGTVSQHDHTVKYMSMFEAAYGHIASELAVEIKSDALAEARESGDTEAIEKAEKALSTAQNKVSDVQGKAVLSAQRSYNEVAGDIVNRRIEGKHNVFRDELMSNRQSHSATAVWTGDPRLNVDQVAMPATMAKELGVDVDRARMDAGDKEADTSGRYVMLWRDPVLRDGAVRYLEVVIDDDLTGVAVSPVIVKSMDGDFDGDSVGLVGNLSDKAHSEAMETLSMEANLLDKGVLLENNGEVKYPLALHDQLDTKVAQFAHPELKERMDEIVLQLNRVEADDSLPRGEHVEINRAYMDDLNDFYKESFADRDQRVRLQFDSFDNHMDSVSQCYVTGAKGSEKKLGEYAEYLSVEKDAQGHWSDVPRADKIDERLREMYIGSQKATAFKAELTGTAGAKSQFAVQLLRGHDAVGKANEITYPATQAMLQAKKDPVDAEYRARVISGPLAEAWKGRKLDAEIVDGRYEWEPVYEKGEPVQATKAEFAEQMRLMMTSDEGMGVPLNMDYVRDVADMLSDPSGRIIDTSRDNWDDLPKEQQPLALDRLAYSTSFDELTELAKEGANLFEGPNIHFAPRDVRENMRRLEKDGVAAEMIPSVAKDTAVDFEPKVKSVAPSRSVRVAPTYGPVIKPSKDSTIEVAEGYDGMSM